MTDYSYSHVRLRFDSPRARYSRQVSPGPLRRRPVPNGSVGAVQEGPSGIQHHHIPTQRGASKRNLSSRRHDRHQQPALDAVSVSFPFFLAPLHAHENKFYRPKALDISHYPQSRAPPSPCVAPRTSKLRLSDPPCQKARFSCEGWILLFQKTRSTNLRSLRA